jgi:tetratricopeptide (TPR) repeat protein
LSSKEKLLASAQKNLLKGQIAKAIKDYQQIVELDPKDIRNRQKLAELYCRAGMNAEALGEYGQVAAYYGDNGFYLKAIAVYKQMQKIDPEQVNVYHRLAELNVKQGLVGNALAEYRNLAAFFEKKNRLPDAIAVLQKMVELEPENLNLQVKIAEYHAQTGLRDKAREEFTQVLALLGNAQEFPRMVKLYEIFLPHFPDDLEINVGFAEALIRKGDCAQGLQILKSLLHKSAEDSRVLRALAQGYRECDDFENERLTYNHLLKQTPGDLELREAFIRAALDGGDHRRALTELEEWKEAFFDAGRTPALKVLYEDLREYLPDNEQIHRALTLVYEQSGDGSKQFDVATVVPNPRSEFSAEGAPSASTEAEDSVAAADTSEISSESQQVEIAPELLTEEMEFELELVLDESLLEVAPALDAQGPAAEPDSVMPASVDFAELEPEGALDELEELVELDSAEDLDGPLSEVLLEAVDVLSGPDTYVDLSAAADERSSDGAFAGFESDEALAALDNLIESVNNVRDELEEAEFYLQQGLLDDAERVCRQILEIEPDSSGAREKLAILAAHRRTTGKPPAEFALFGLPETADAGEAQPDPDQSTVPETADRVNHEESFDEFRIAVDTPIDIDDTETHYNLGIAYKEMGLLDEAVAEFDKAMRNPGRMVDSLTLKGSCLFAKGDLAQAEKVFKSGLVYPGLNTAERVSLYYEMGLLYEAWGRPLEALDSFQAAADVDLFFRDVGEKIETLRKNLGLDVNTDKEDTGAGGSRSRVSYI